MLIVLSGPSTVDELSKDDHIGSAEIARTLLEGQVREMRERVDIQ